MGLPLIAVVIWQSMRRDPVRVVPRSPAALSPRSSVAADDARRTADLARAFLATDSVSARAAFVRHPEVTRPRMEAWYTASNPLRPVSVRQFHDRSVEQRIGDLTFIMLYMDLVDFSTRAIAVEKGSDGEFKVDWESFEEWSAVPWLDFVATEPAGALEFRVVAERDTYFNFGYGDPGRWACFKLTDPESRLHIWGYCAVNSEADLAFGHLLRRQLVSGQSQVKAMVRLRFEDGNLGHHQARIEAVVQDGWLKPGP